MARRTCSTSIATWAWRAAAYTLIGFPIALASLYLAHRYSASTLLIAIRAVFGLAVFIAWLIWFGAWAVICGGHSPSHEPDTGVSLAQSLSFFLLCTLLASQVAIPVTTMLAGNGAIVCACVLAPLAFIASVIHRILICRRAHTLSDLVADMTFSRVFLVPASVLNLLGLAYFGGLGFILLARGEPSWVFLTATLWYPPLACAFWIYVLTRLIRGTSAMLGARGNG